MSNIEFQINDDDLKRMAEQGKKAIDLAIKYTATEAWAEVKKEAPTDHGRLAGSFSMEKVGDGAYRIFSNVEYALWVHDGTGIHGPAGRPYEIRPVEKKALFWPGAAHPVKSVLHPGVPGNPYADRAIDNAGKRTDEFIRRAINETLGSVA